MFYRKLCSAKLFPFSSHLGPVIILQSNFVSSSYDSSYDIGSLPILMKPKRWYFLGTNDNVVKHDTHEGKCDLLHHCCESSRGADGKLNWRFVKISMFGSYDSSYSNFNSNEIIHSDIILCIFSSRTGRTTDGNFTHVLGCLLLWSCRHWIFFNSESMLNVFPEDLFISST